MSTMEDRRFALVHLTFERNAIMATPENNGIEDAQKALATLGWRWIKASMEPRRETNPKHAAIVDRIEMLQMGIDDLLRSFYMGNEPTDEQWDDVLDEADWLANEAYHEVMP